MTQWATSLLNLGEKSAFNGKESLDKIYGADYNRDETITHHHHDIHEYQISKTILNADVLISVPKLKVHKKVGVTLNSKGLVGINTNKNYLVHYTLGSPKNGGDQFPNRTLSRKEAFLVKSQRFLFDKLLAKQNTYTDHTYRIIKHLFQRYVKPWFGSVSQEKLKLDGGNWYGNDSAWRMAFDLVNISIFSDKDGVMQEIPQRKFFSVIDGIIGGENNGPLTPDARSDGVLIVGFHPLATDIVSSYLMGLNWQKMKTFTSLLHSKHKEFQIGDPQKTIPIHTNVSNWKNFFDNNKSANLHYKPHPGWTGHIELDN